MEGEPGQVNVESRSRTAIRHIDNRGDRGWAEAHSRRRKCTGAALSSEYTFKFDGIPVTPVAVTPPPTTATAYSSKKVDDCSYDISTTVDGKPTVTSRLTIAADGRTINQAMSGTNPQGQTVKSALVWDKQ